MIGAYSFDEIGSANYSKRSGRTALSNKLKEALIKQHGSRCFIYLEVMPERELQIDHRIPYEVAGDLADEEQDPKNFMLLCGSANRAKSWTCEHCQNFLVIKQVKICQSCYWAYPEDHQHVAMQEQRRVDIVWSAQEISSFEKVKAQAHQQKFELPTFVKAVLNRSV
jgi:hypothetical protein